MSVVQRIKLHHSNTLKIVVTFLVFHVDSMSTKDPTKFHRVRHEPALKNSNGHQSPLYSDMATVASNSSENSIHSSYMPPEANHKTHTSNSMTHSTLRDDDIQSNPEDIHMNHDRHKYSTDSFLTQHEDSILTKISSYQDNYDAESKSNEECKSNPRSESDSKFIEINVGGIKYQSTIATLCKYRSSRLSFAIQPALEGGVIFLDRDGTVFQYILNWLRSDVLVLPRSAHNDYSYIINQLLIESRYYGLHGLVDELIMLKLDSRILSTSTSNHAQKQNIHHIRRLINSNYRHALDNDKRLVFTQEWKSLFKYDVSTYSSSISPATILQNKCGGTRSLLILFVAQNQMFCVYYYEPWNEKAYRRKNWLYWIGQHLHDKIHSNKLSVCTIHSFTGSLFLISEYVSPLKNGKEPLSDSVFVNVSEYTERH